MASLYVVSGPDKGRRFELQADIARLGRDRANAIQLMDTEVSRCHAEIQWDEGIYQLADLESSNGTYVNGKLTSRKRLVNGDSIEIGQTRLVFLEQTADQTALPEESVAIVAGGEVDQSQILHTATSPSMLDTEFSRPIASDSSVSQRATSLDVMYRTALAVSRTLDIDVLLARILELIFEWVDADRGCVMLQDPDSGRLVPRARHDRDESTDKPITLSRTILHYVMDRKEGLLTSNASDDDRWDAAASILDAGVQEAICAPMQGRYGIVGVIYVDTVPEQGVPPELRTSRFDEEHLKLLVAIAHQAALAVEDTTFYGAMVQSERLAAMGQTIATLSHHIKNILQGVRGGSYLVTQGLEDDNREAIANGWAIVEKNQQKISHLVQDMLSVSKPRQPTLELADVLQLVEEAIDVMRARADEAGVALSLDRPDQPLSCQLDVQAMQHALLNVLANGIDATEGVEGGSVSLAVVMDLDEGHVGVEVRDNGPGLSAADLQEVFSLFYSSKGQRGTGLGLAVSDKILREHGGRIEVESRPGEGALFRLHWPSDLTPDDFGQQKD